MHRPGSWHGVLRIGLLVASVAAVAAHAAPPPFPGLATVTVTSADVDLPIPDNGSLVSILPVAGVAGTLVDVDVTLDIAHPQPDQLDVWLVAPSGATVTLTTDNGAGFDDVFAGATFDDQAPGTPSAPNVRNFTYADAVPVGAIQPEEALGALVGESADGPWALVVVDDTGGQAGILHGWSLTLSTVAGVGLSAPADFTGGGGAIPNNTPTGLESMIAVAGLGAHLYDVDVTLDITHPNAADLDVFLTAPSGRRIDLVTDVGGTNDGLYVGTVFDDQAGLPASDTALPPDGTPFARVAGEGALAAFLGEGPNGTWTLTVADDASGNIGTLNGWTLRLVTATACGDGTVDAAEVCDDGNRADGDGCDTNCTATACGNGIVSPGEDCDDGNTADGDGCPSTCRTGESDCANCVDDDGNGLVDEADPACQGAALDVTRATITRGGRARMTLGGTAAVSAAPAGPVGLLVADGGGTVVCADLGTLRPRGRTFVAKGRAAGGTITVKLTPQRGGGVSLGGRGLDLHALDDPGLTIGLRIGADRFIGHPTLRARGARRWVYP